MTVRLNDSLKRYDSVEIVLLAVGDSAQPVGTVWKGALVNPGSLPPFQLAEGETRDLSVRVRGFDSSGRLALNMLISRRNGAQVVADLPIPTVIVPPDTTPPAIPPKPSGLKVLTVSPGALSPAWDTSLTKYVIKLDYADSTITFNAVPLSAKAVVRIGIDTLPNGVISQPFSLKVGNNLMPLTSTMDGRTTHYHLVIKRDTPPMPDTAIAGDRSLYRTWKRRGTVFVDLRTLGMDRSWSETGIPLLVRLTGSNFDFSQATYNGRDIRFAAADGARIPFEFVRWEPENERAEIWFRSDTLRAADDSGKFYMYWGSTSAKVESDGRGVFARGEGHTAAYHLDEQGNGTSNEYKDAAGLYHGQAGNGNGRSVPARVESIVGYGQDFNIPANASSNATRTAIGLPATLDPGKDAWTFQTWIKRMGDDDMTLFKKSEDWVAGSQRFELFIKGGSGGRFGAFREGAEVFSNVHIPSHNYTHLGVVYTGSRYDIFVDGWFREGHTWSQGGASLGDCVLGAYFSDGSRRGFQGIMDEVWISSQVRSPMWMRMTFENQKPGSNLVTLRR